VHAMRLADNEEISRFGRRGDVEAIVLCTFGRPLPRTFEHVKEIDNGPDLAQAATTVSPPGPSADLVTTAADHETPAAAASDDRRPPMWPS